MPRFALPLQPLRSEPIGEAHIPMKSLISSPLSVSAVAVGRSRCLVVATFILGLTLAAAPLRAQRPETQEGETPKDQSFPSSDDTAVQGGPQSRDSAFPGAENLKQANICSQLLLRRAGQRYTRTLPGIAGCSMDRSEEVS